MASAPPEFDRQAAVVRSLLGWGVVAGPFFVAFSLVIAANRPGFDLGADSLGLLLVGGSGWVFGIALVLSGAMTIVAASGLWRTPDWPRTAAVLVAVYGGCLVLSAFAIPDAAGSVTPTVPGVLHLVFGAIGSLTLGVAAIVAGGWFRRRTSRGSLWSLVAGIVVIIGFAAGGAVEPESGGVLFTWLGMIVGWLWLALTSIAAYRAVPHPLRSHRQVPGDEALGG
ncbi:DUF998 domain-containing protein [Herbiconiux liangxiaofengii]|uniref:DUF998 domain-containing protein n=1 Tax=Herbiconiux liangxiaofengii TaxID=3342795 RepID=UPI0035B73D4E